MSAKFEIPHTSELENCSINTDKLICDAVYKYFSEKKNQKVESLLETLQFFNSWWPKIVPFGELFQRLTTVIGGYFSEVSSYQHVQYACPYHWGSLVQAHIMSIWHNWARKLALHTIFNISKLTFLEKGRRSPKSDFKFLILVKKCSRKISEWLPMMTHKSIMTSQTLYSEGQTLWRHNSFMSHQWQPFGFFSRALFHED